MRTRLRRASLLVVAALAARCAFPDVSMVASNGASGSSGGTPTDEGGTTTGDAVPLADGGIYGGDALSTDPRDATSPSDLDATQPRAEASATLVDGARPTDGESPVDAAAPPVDARSPGLDAVAPNADAAMPRVDAAPPPQEDAGSPVDAGHVKQYAANVDCTSVAVADCNSTIGFTDDPDCGDTGTLVQCGTSTTHSNSGNGNSDNAADKQPKESCVILLQVTAVQTCL